jgi:3-(methylthio)propanoyl-CoA dehydrogenase
LNYYSDDPEWKWMFKNGINWDTIISLYYPTFPTEDGFENKEEVLTFLEELVMATGDWCANAVANRAHLLDEHGPGQVLNGRTIPNEHLEKFYSEAKELGIFGLLLPRKFGGLHCPNTIGMMAFSQLGRACLSSCTQLAFFSSMADMAYRFLDDEKSDRIVPQIVEGNLSGSMCLTEPGCGSDLGMLKTTATPQEDGTYLLNGSKIFITNGGGGMGFVLAKIKGSEDSLDGISMFFTEQEIEGSEELNYTIEKSEHKMGLHGSFTCTVVYDNSKATLVGNAEDGFKYMLHLMNEARIAVGFQALGVMEASLKYARDYAEERVQFGKPIAELPLMKRNLEDFETERDAIRALLVDTESHFDIYQLLHLKKTKTNDLTKEEEVLFEEAKLWTRKRTPLVKYYACEASTTLTQRAIQVLGGYGFMKEYPVERYHRDSFAPLLYEGTSQIQALMALKDVVKYAIQDPTKFFSSVFYKHPAAEFLNLTDEWNRQYKSAHYRFKKKMIGLLYSCLNPGAAKILSFKAWADPENVNDLMIHAETLTQALSYMETLRVLCEHSNKDSKRADLFYRYHKLIQPRMEAIYKDWTIRT